ncbi:dynein heavy chain 2, axonemal [Caerostris extrusa]|uniref:Dynein heavy chain 2, axonemal n=1 Tax=Caerostris extrusa TaxID=172846 RepID=A0AAV4QQQ2_CAEEX|nr:dynein heavy chain 2, axonemal [Caerostris extrusa]
MSSRYSILVHVLCNVSCVTEWLASVILWRRSQTQKVHKKFSPSVWSIKDISPQINLFVHRCQELILVCEFKDDFLCEEDIDNYSPGEKGYGVAEQMKIIEIQFWNYLHELGKNRLAALQIRSAMWTEFFKKFRKQIDELEVNISKLMVVKRDLRRCVKTMYTIFLNELNFVKEKLADLKSSDNPLLPHFGGQAYCASILPQRLKKFMKIVESLLTEKNEIFTDIIASIEEAVKPVLSNLYWAVPPSVIKPQLTLLFDQTKWVSFREERFREIAELVKAQIYEANLICNIFKKEKNEMCFIPNFKEICLSFENFIKEIEAGLREFMSFEEHLTGGKDGPNLKNAINMIGIFTLASGKPIKWNFLTGYGERGWNADDFEEDINRFLDVGQKVLLIPRYKALEFCLVDCHYLKDSAVSCAEQWKNELGSILHKIASSNLKNAFDLFELTSSKFKEDPKNLEELKNCIHFLISTKKNIPMKFTELSEQLTSISRFLKRVEIPIKEKEQQRDLHKMWKQLETNFENYYIKLQKIQAVHQRHFLAYHKELEQHTNTLEKDIYEQGPFEIKHSYGDALDLIAYYRNILLRFQEKEKRMKEDAIFFHIDLKTLEKLTSIENDLYHLRISWSYVKQLDNHLEKWGNLPVLTFDVENKKQISNDLQNNTEILYNKVKGAQWILLTELLDRLDSLNKYYEMILDFQEPNLQERHWNDLRDLLGIICDDSEQFFKSNDFTFSFLRNLTIENLAENVNKIATQARKEYEIEQSLKEMEKAWGNIEFKMSDLKKFHKAEDTESIISQVERHQTTLAMMKSSKFVFYFSSTVDSWEDSLLLILDVIKQIDYFQIMFYNSIKSSFCNSVMPNSCLSGKEPSTYLLSKQYKHNFRKEASEVQEVSAIWKETSAMMNKKKLVWKICHKEGFLERITGINKVVEKVQQSIEFYLESKRRAFPRFYFISNDDLLAIIGQEGYRGIQPHLKKCFDSINKINIVEKVEEKLRETFVTYLATGMYSEYGEFVEFKSAVILEGPVESWLLDIEEMMQITLYSALPKSLQMLSNILSKENFNLSNHKWLSNWPSQICVLSMLVTWTAETTNSIKTVQETAVTTALKNLRKRWRDILNQCVSKLQKANLIN